MAFDRFSENEDSQGKVARRLKDEIDSWRPYADALRLEDREVFREMLNNVAASYTEAIDRAERGYDTESVMMSILLNQQKTIRWLAGTLKRMKEDIRSAPL